MLKHPISSIEDHADGKGHPAAKRKIYIKRRKQLQRNVKKHISGSVEAIETTEKFTGLKKYKSIENLSIR